jgi:dTDP-D-glucose 4,6-dehydratase
MRKVMDTSRIKATGWEPKVSLREGIEFTYEWFVDSMGGIRGMDDEVNEILKKNCCEGCGGE